MSRQAVERSRAVASYGYDVMAGVWNGFRAGFDDLGPAAFLALAGSCILLIWAFGGGR